MRTILMSLALTGCLGTTPSLVSPPPLSLTSTEFYVGQTATMTVNGLQPNEVVHLVRGRAQGSGPCIGSICLDIRDARYMRSSTADSNGRATFVFDLPASVTAGMTSWFQAVALRGPNSVATVPIFAVVFEPPATTSECNDGIDNDGDGLTDWQYDLGCTGTADATEGGIPHGLDNGWLVLEPAADTQIFYVSSSVGDDSYDGLAPEFDGVHGPKATLQAAYALTTEGQPDWILLRRGDVFEGSLLSWRRSGRSETEPMVIATYGDSIERPRFEMQGETWILGGGGSSAPEHLRILGIHVDAVSKDPNDERFTARGGACLSWVSDGGDVWLEDMYCEHAPVTFQGDATEGSFTLRRSVIDRTYSVQGHQQAIFTSVGVPLTIEETVLHHGGWSDVFRFAAWNPETDPAVWAAIDDGQIGVELDGTVVALDGLDFTGASSRADVAQVLQTALMSAAQTPIEVRFSEIGGALQVRAPALPGSHNYGFVSYPGSASGTPLDGLIEVDGNADLDDHQGTPNSTIFNRNAYLAYGDGGTIYRGNIDADGASGGVQLRQGGLIEDNLFLDNPRAIVVGHAGNKGGVVVGGEVIDNVILGARDIDTQPQGTGIAADAIASAEYGTAAPSPIDDLLIAGNLLLHQREGTGNINGIHVGGDGLATNVVVRDNLLYNWARDAWSSPNDQRANGIRVAPATGSSILIEDNIVQQTTGGYCFTARDDYATTTTWRGDICFSAAANPGIWSEGWYSLGSTVDRATWLASTGHTDLTEDSVDFVDPDRDIAAYDAMLGGDGSYASFMDGALRNQKFQWDPAYTATEVNRWIREGYVRP